MDDSITMRDPALQARAASTAYAQAHAILEAEPAMTAADLVDRLRQRAAELAAAAGSGPAPVEPPAPHAPPSREPDHPGLGAAAAKARDRMSGGSAATTDA